MDDAKIVGNIDKFSQTEVVREYQRKRGAREQLTIIFPKFLIQSSVIRLSCLQREAILKLYWENLSIEQIAHQMKLSRKSVQKLIETALVTIRKRLTSEEELSPA